MLYTRGNVLGDFLCFQRRLQIMEQLNGLNGSIFLKAYQQKYKATGYGVTRIRAVKWLNLELKT